VQVLDARGCAIDFQFEIVFDVLCRSAVGVGRLDDANLQLVSQVALAHQVADKAGDERGDAVSVQEPEYVLLVFEVVDDAVGVAVERAAAVAGPGFGRGRGALVGFYKVCSAL
jgi:hypothetical protein